jgi:hypothetical protein
MPHSVPAATRFMMQQSAAVALPQRSEHREDVSNQMAYSKHVYHPPGSTCSTCNSSSPLCVQPGGTASMLSANGTPTTASSILASAAAAPAAGPFDAAAAPQEAGSSAPQAEAGGLMDAVIQQAKRVRLDYIIQHHFHATLSSAQSQFSSGTEQGRDTSTGCSYELCRYCSYTLHMPCAGVNAAAANCWQHWSRRTCHCRCQARSQTPHRPR